MVSFDTIKDELLAVVDTALKYGRSLDSTAEVEVYTIFEQRVDVEIAQGVVSAKDGPVAGTAARVAIGRRIGFASASGVTEERVKLAVKEAHNVAAKVDVENDRFQGFCDPVSPAKEGLFHDAILELTTKDLIQTCETLIEDAKTVDERAKIFSANADVWWGAYAVGNTRGVLAATRTMGNSCSIDVQAIQGEERRSSFDFDVARDRVLEIEGLGARVAKEAVSLLGAKKLDYTGKLTTIWTPIPASFFILSSLGRSTLGQTVVEKISPLCDRLGEEIAASSLTIVDDGQNPTSIATNAVDAEGHPQQRNTLIEKGVLRSFLFDSYNARAYGVEPTGNAERGGGLFGSSVPYEQPVSVGTKFLDVQPGTKDFDSLVSSIDKQAVLIYGMPLGIFHSSVATGEFSVVANSVYLVKDGEIQNPIHPVSIAGNYYEGFKQIIEIGADVRNLLWGANVPTFVFDGFTVVG